MSECICLAWWFSVITGILNYVCLCYTGRDERMAGVSEEEVESTASAEETDEEEKKTRGERRSQRHRQ